MKHTVMHTHSHTHRLNSVLTHTTGVYKRRLVMGSKRNSRSVLPSDTERGRAGSF